MCSFNAIFLIITSFYYFLPVPATSHGLRLLSKQALRSVVQVAIETHVDVELDVAPKAVHFSRHAVEVELQLKRACEVRVAQN